MKKIKVKINSEHIFEFDKKTKLIEIVEYAKKKGIKLCNMKALAAKVNNQVRELDYELLEDSEIRFIDLYDEDGKRIYRRSLHFILMRAIKAKYPQKEPYIKHSISKGIYFEIRGDKEITEEEVKEIENEMRKIIEKRIPFIKKEVPIDEAKKIFKETNREEKFNIVEHREKSYVSMYELDGMIDYFYGYMVLNTSYLNQFRLKRYKYGVIIIFPDRNDPNFVPEFGRQEKLYDIFRKHETYGYLLNCASLGDLNLYSKNEGIEKLIEKSEYIHDVQIKELALKIFESGKRIVLLAGPSSSGKTSTALRLARKLNDLSMNAITISMDDYYKNQIETPIDENGEHDLEHINALDIALFKMHLKSLIEGMEIKKPFYDFNRGLRSKKYQRIKLSEKDIIIIEGIHGLNPIISEGINDEYLFRIYVSALTSMNIDDHNRIPTTDLRLLRRLVRDKQFRNSDVNETLKRWPSVRRGEEKFIFPYQNNSEAMFNTALFYELAILKDYANNMLKEITNENPEFSEAKRLLAFLSYIYPSKTKNIPSDSILREFTGGSILFKK